MTTFSESAVGYATLASLNALGYVMLHGPDIVSDQWMVD
jgi:hypothetical protein